MPEPQDMVFGRDAELAELAAFLDDVPSGPSAFLLDGDPGVGKTTLWNQALTAARSRAFRVLTCRPTESETKLSFAALGDLLGRVLQEVHPSLPPPQRRALDVAMLQAEPEGAPPDGRAVSLAVLATLRLLSSAGPLVVALDDVQWLDAPTARVLGFALRRLEADPIGILLTLRSGDEGPIPLGLDRVLPEPRLRRLTVGPVTVEALGQLVRSRLGSAFPRRTLARLHDMSGGNPFLAVEIARASLRGDAPAGGDSLLVPHSLRELLVRRVEALPAPDREALQAAAALSAPSVALVEAAVGKARASKALAAGSKADVLRIEDGQVRFTHPLFGSAILSLASAEQRGAVHRRLAVITTDPEERARHLALAADPPDEEVAQALDRAALEARSRGAPDAAAELLEMALRFTASDRSLDRLERALGAANYYLVVGDTHRAGALMEGAVAEAPAGVPSARALRGLATVRSAEQSWPMARDLQLRALREAGEDLGLRGQIEQALGYAGLFTGDKAMADSHSAAALELAEAVNHPGAVAEALQFVAYLEFMQGRGLRFDLLDRAVALEEEAQEYWVWDELRPSLTRAQLLKYADRFDEARSALQEMLSWSVQRGREHPIPVLLHHLAELECWAGNWDAAAAFAREGLEAVQHMGMPVYRAVLLYASGLVDAHRGRVDVARAAATEGLALAESVGSVMSQILNLSVLGFLELFMGSPEGAHRLLGRAVQQATAMGVEEPALFRFVPDEVEALIATGELDEAAGLLDPFEERAARLDRAWGMATGARCRGLLLAAAGDLPGAIDALTRALVEHERVPEPFALARTHFVMGMVRRRAKLRGEARESFERALEIYARLGAHTWAERAGHEARRVGARVPGPLQLTATEERVASLVAQGRTNREAADALFVSVNTIEWNLTRIYRKLGVRSRTELASKLRHTD
jgi:DNA-binding CsgD family transcriptional regulator